jgi:hypothetical protein
MYHQPLLLVLLCNNVQNKLLLLLLLQLLFQGTWTDRRLSCCFKGGQQRKHTHVTLLAGLS